MGTLLISVILLSAPENLAGLLMDAHGALAELQDASHRTVITASDRGESSYLLGKENRGPEVLSVLILMIV